MKIKYQGTKKWVTFRQLFDIHFAKARYEGDGFDYFFAITFNGRDFVWYITKTEGKK